MMKPLLSLALVLLMSAPTFAEITLHESSDNTVKMKGWLDVRAAHTQSQTELADGVSRVNFNFSRDMGSDWKAFGVVETGVNLVGRTNIAFAGGDSFQTRRDDLLNLRLGYVGMSHPKWGELSLGKRWGAYVDLAEITDYGRTWGGSAFGVYNFNGDGGLSGTGRAEQAVQYRNSWGGFSLALQTQQQTSSDEIDEFDLPSVPVNGLAQIEYDSTVGATVSYRFGEEHFIAAAFNEGTFEGTFRDGGLVERDDEIAALGYRYGKYADGLYIATVYADAEFHELDNLNRLVPESTGFEVYASYRGDSRFMPFFVYNSLEAGSAYETAYGGDQFHREFFVLGAIYFWSEKTELYLDVRFDSSSMSAPQSQFEDDGVGLGMRYVF